MHRYAVSAVDGFNDADAARFAEESGGTLHLIGGIETDFRWDSISRGYEMFDGRDVIFCGPVEATPHILNEAAKKFNVHNASAESVSMVRDLTFLQSVAVEDITFPSTEYDGKGRWLVKNIHGAGGTSVRDYAGGELADGEYLQKHIEGKSVGACFVTSKGETSLIGTTRHITGIKHFGQPEFWYGGLLYPAGGGNGLRERMEKFGRRAGRESRLSGVWGADFILDGDGRLWLLEINPRFTSSLELIAKAHGIDIARLQIEAVRGDAMPVSLPDPGYVTGTAVCYAQSDFRFGLGEVIDDSVRDIPRQGTFIRRGEPLLSVYAEGDRHDDCMERLRKKAAPFCGRGAPAKGCNMGGG
jgi:predicted ATP-grasp superfamily ATP-dependent carboligase